MNAPAPAPAPAKQISPVDQFRTQLDKMGPQFANALPAHIPVERFSRVVMTAIQNNPKLLACTRQSIFNAAMKCAQDGLLPDGREAAIVPFGENEDGQKKVDQATYMPMIAGIRKKARNSGELSDWYAEIVHAGDEFEYQLGDDPHIMHKPALTGGRTRKITHAYSIAKFKDGGISREVMTIDEIEDIRRKYSRARKGPWSDPIAYPEMCRKTVARLHAKQLPMSSDLDTLLRRDDDLYDMAGARDRGKPITRRQPADVMGALSQFAGSIDRSNDDKGEPPVAAFAGTEPPAIEDLGDPRPGDDVMIDGDTGEVIGPAEGDAVEAAEEPDAAETLASLIRNGANTVKDAETFNLLATSVMEAAKQMGGAGADALAAWWQSDKTRRLRANAGVSVDEAKVMQTAIKSVIDSLRSHQ